ncbi:MAG TPA: PAS domain S-box protein, partial [Bacteroidales bacterium]|nr:PAS domain S-box protein [Bacteroidales bacterium]
AMGSSFSLKENIHSFVRVLMARKNIDIVNVWLKGSVLDNTSKSSGYNLVYSNPRFRIIKDNIPENSLVATKSRQGKAFSISYLSPDFNEFITEQGVHKGVYTVYTLGDMGLIKMYQFARRYEWDEVELKKLEKVIEQFTQSIISTLNHTRVVKEVEKRNKAEEELKIRDKEFRNLVNAVNDVFWVFDANSQHFTQLSPALELILGATADQLAQDPYEPARRIVADNSTEAKNIWEKAILSPEYSSDFAIRMPDGEIRWLRSVSQNITVKGSNEHKMAGTFTDITGMKQAEQEREFRLDFEQVLLEISTSFINTPAHKIDAGINDTLRRIGSFAEADRSYIFQFHHEGTLMSNTHEWCNKGVDPAIDDLQNPPSNTFPWWIEKLSKFESIFLPTLDHLPEKATTEREILESQSILSLVVIPLASRGNLKGFIGFDFVKNYVSFSEDIVKLLRFVGQMITNILENKEQNEQLKRQEERYQSIVESATDIIYRINRNSQFIFMNEKTLEVTGFSRHELLGMDFEQIIHPVYVANISRFYRDQFRKNIETTYIEFPIINRFGEQLWVGQNASLYKNNEGAQELTVVGRDITDIINANISLKEAYQKAERASQSKTQFVINTSHEIRTPAHAISGLVDILSKTQLSTDQKRVLQKLKSTSKSLNMLIDNVIDFKKIESETMDLKEDAFNISELLKTLSDMLRYMAEENNVSFSYNIATGVSPDRKGDLGKLQRILINLTENAIKFNEGGKAVISVREAKEGDDVIFIVEDNGIGIDPEIIKQVDNEFDQSDNSTTRKYEGSGLGLYISIELIKLMGGHARIENKQDKGTIITFSIPLRKQEKNKATHQGSPVAEASKKSFPHLRMLIAEDNKINQLVASRALKSLGIEHDIASNGRKAVEMVKENHYDAILMDLMMPEMDGFEATVNIRQELKQEMPIIACTAKKVKGTPEECYEVGMDAYITKPFNESDIRNKLNLLHL